MKITTVYFLRHGKVENPKNIIYGRLPGFSLSVTGAKEIEQVAKYFQNNNVSHIYTSPLLRARQTANIIGRRIKLTPKVSRLITEVKIVFAGVEIAEYERKLQPRLYSKEFIDKGSESIKEIEERMLRFLDMIKKRHSGGNILVISHGDPIMILKAKILGIPFTWQYKRNNYLQLSKWYTLIIYDNKYQWR